MENLQDLLFSAGSYGSYYKLDEKIGVKLPTSFMSTRSRIRQEGKFLRLLNRVLPGLFPTFKGFVWERNEDNKRVLGYKMEHIDGKTMYQFIDHDSRDCDGIDCQECTSKALLTMRLKGLMFEVGLFWRDASSLNIIFDKPQQKWRCLDADRAFFDGWTSRKFKSAVAAAYKQLRKKKFLKAA